VIPTEGDAVPRLSRVVPALVLASVLSSLAVAPPAAGGTYSVRQCDYAAGSDQHDFVWQSAGAPTVDPHSGSGCGEFGLAVRNGGGGTQRTYPSGAYGGWFAYAPNGTVFTDFAGAFGTLEGCCVSGMASYAEATQAQDGQGGRAYLFQGSLGNNSWSPTSGVQGPVGRSWSSATSGFDARRVGFQLRCGPGFSCAQGNYGDLRVRGRSFDFTLRDDTPPTVGEAEGTLLSGTWMRGVQTLSFLAHDGGGGLTGVEAAFDVGMVLGSPSNCTTVAGRYARLQPCPTARVGEWSVDTARLRDGGRYLTLRATDAGGTTTAQTVAAFVDNTAPTQPRDLTLAGGDGWRPANGFELGWANPGGQYAPIARARWRACPASNATGQGDCVGGERAAPGVTASGPIALPAAGEWDVRLWLVDGAGNGDPEQASAPLRLRFDPDPPALRFLRADPGAPERVAVETEDLSGVVDGTLELRRRGTETWTTLPTERAGSRLTAVLDGRRLASGTYDVRARAVDVAGNEGIGHGEARTIAERGGAVAAVERLPEPSGRGTAPATPAPRRATPRRARVTIAVRARVARRPGARRPVIRRWGRSQRRIAVAGGRTLLFHGRVGRPLPRHGKLVEVQAHFRGRWRTISAVRSRRDGRWRFRYAFRPTAWQASYRLRARAPVEGGYPFAAGVSRPVRVTVLPFPR
jgi:hypothetical protein